MKKISMAPTPILSAGGEAMARGVQAGEAIINELLRSGISTGGVDGDGGSGTAPSVSYRCKKLLLMVVLLLCCEHVQPLLSVSLGAVEAVVHQLLWQCEHVQQQVLLMLYFVLC